MLLSIAPFFSAQRRGFSSFLLASKAKSTSHWRHRCTRSIETTPERGDGYRLFSSSGGPPIENARDRRLLLHFFQPQQPTFFPPPPHPTAPHPPATQNKTKYNKKTAEANPRDQGLPPHGPPQGRPRRPREEGRRRRHQVQGPLLAPPLHARRRRRREGEQAQTVAAPGARRARQPVKRGSGA